ncbi:MAG: hypothetical protein NTX27_19555 [Verrucomicrobia bacterium]|nr:hypothetical protein [Verrucomicrobiota bacterium]
MSAELSNSLTRLVSGGADIDLRIALAILSHRLGMGDACSSTNHLRAWSAYD